jgi:hypothetical protein
VSFQVFGLVGREDAQIDHLEKRAHGEEEGRPDLSRETSRHAIAGPPIRRAARSCTYTR